MQLVRPPNTRVHQTSVHHKTTPRCAPWSHPPNQPRHHVMRASAPSTVEQSPAQQQFMDVRTVLQSTSETNTSFHMQEMIEFLKEDLQHLFDDQGIDASKYDDVVDFIDPITRYNNLGGYLFNIQMLRYVFAPQYIMHDIKQTGPWEITTRWTMDMRFTPIESIAPLAKVWRPKLLFTGVSIMQVNPETKRFCRHIDLWDAVQNNDYFSLEAAAHVAGQLFDLKRTPQIETPQYTVLRRAADYEIRRYAPFVAASAAMDTPARDPATARRGTGAFQAIASYIFGGNKGGQKIAMTTPVLTTSDDRMRFMMPSAYAAPEALPVPSNQAVQVEAVPGAMYAARAFNGVADEAACAAQLQQLKASLVGDGYAYGDAWQVARYNDPSTKAPFRRNEVLLPVTNFDLWGPGTDDSSR